MSIVTCGCGSKVRIPEGATAVRCPRCKQPLSAAIAVQVLNAHVAGPGEAGAMCPICQTGVDREATVLSCPECQTVHHHECWDEVGGCGTYGCSRAPAPVKGASAEAAAAAWGDTKMCPSCGEEIRGMALKCRYCNTYFDSAAPMTRKEYTRVNEQKGAQKATRVASTVIFVLSLIGCLGPVMLVVNLVWILTSRPRISRAGPMYPVLAYFGLGLTVIYSLLIAGFLIHDAVSG